MIRLMTQVLRVEHWVKNLFVLMPVFFAAKLFETDVLMRSMIGLGAFSFVASAVYVLNDLVDAPQDRNHPEKRNRPIASGEISRRSAIMLLTALLIGGLATALWLNAIFFMICSAYFIVNLLYSFWLKHIAIVDVSLIGLGFLLRIFAGGAVAGVEVSNWLIVLTFILALILGLAKRRGEYIVATGGHSFRKALEGYNLPFLDVAITICSTVAIVAYLMYCFSKEVTDRIGSDQIYYTAFFVILGIMRYLQLTLVFNRTESPTRALLQDRFLQVVLLAWIGAFTYVLYVKPQSALFPFPH